MPNLISIFLSITAFSGFMYLALSQTRGEAQERMSKIDSKEDRADIIRSNKEKWDNARAVMNGIGAKPEVIDAIKEIYKKRNFITPSRFIITDYFQYKSGDLTYDNCLKLVPNGYQDYIEAYTAVHGKFDTPEYLLVNAATSTLTSNYYYESGEEAVIINALVIDHNITPYEWNSIRPFIINAQNEGYITNQEFCKDMLTSFRRGKLKPEMLQESKEEEKDEIDMQISKLENDIETIIAQKKKEQEKEEKMKRLKELEEKLEELKK